MTNDSGSVCLHQLRTHCRHYHLRCSNRKLKSFVAARATSSLHSPHSVSLLSPILYNPFWYPFFARRVSSRDRPSWPLPAQNSSIARPECAREAACVSNLKIAHTTSLKLELIILRFCCFPVLPRTAGVFWGCV